MVRLADVPEPERSNIANLDCPTYAHTPFTTAPSVDQRHVTLVSTAGFIVRGERPTLPSDAGYRTIASSVGDGDILCSHVSVDFDRTGFQQDLNCVLPRDRLHEFVHGGLIAAVAENHYSFMGATEPAKMEPHARRLAQSLGRQGVDTALLLPV